MDQIRVEGLAFHQRLWRSGGKLAGNLPALKGALGAAPTPVARAVAAGSPIRRWPRSPRTSKFRFNRGVAKIYEFANALAEVKDRRRRRRPLGPARSLDTLTLLIGPMMPHLAEEIWHALGRKTLVAETAWPEADPTLIIDDTVTVAVQVNSKLRATIELPRDADGATPGAAPGEDAVQRALDGKGQRR